MNILDDFLKYIAIPTTSNSKSIESPSTKSQSDFAELLVEEFRKIKVDNVYYDNDHCYVYAMLKV